MIQKRAGGVELPLGESDYDQKHTLKRNPVYFCNVAFHQHQEQTPRKIKQKEKQKGKRKPDYLHVLKELQNFISFLHKVKIE